MTGERINLGRIHPDRIRLPEVPRLPEGVVEGLCGIGSLSGLVADAMDKMGLRGVVPGSRFRLNMPGAAIVGPALTVRNIAQETDPYEIAPTYKSTKYGRSAAQAEAHNIARPGDVLVIEGVPDVSNLGGVSSMIGKRQGELGAVVDGAVRDVDDMRRISYPAWSTSVSPLTGIWRAETVEILGPVTVCGVSVSPGDLVVADETGVCFCPRQATPELVARVLDAVRREEEFVRQIESGMPMHEMPTFAATR